MATDPKKTIGETDTAIAAYYNQLAGQLGQGVNAQQASFNTARGDIGNIYDEMTSSLTNQANSTASGLVDEMNMLGIGAANDAATQQLRGQLNQSLISAARRKATEMGGLTSQGAAYKAAGLEGVGNVRREGVRSRTDVRTRLEEAMATLEAAKAEAEGQYALQKLQGEIELQRARAASRGGGGGGGRGGSPLDMLRAQILGMQILEKQNELEGGGKSQWSKRGQGGLNQFLNVGSDYWENRAGPKFRAGIDDILDYAEIQGSKLGEAGVYQDPYRIAMSRIPKAPSYLNEDALRMALQIYYGKG